MVKVRPEYDMKVIGANLKRLREAKSLSVQEVCEYVKYGSVQALYRIESGKGFPQVDTLLALMELYECYDIRQIVQKNYNQSQCKMREGVTGQQFSYMVNYGGDKVITEFNEPRLLVEDLRQPAYFRLKAYYDYLAGGKHNKAS